MLSQWPRTAAHTLDRRFESAIVSSSTVSAEKGLDRTSSVTRNKSSSMWRFHFVMDAGLVVERSATVSRKR